MKQRVYDIKKNALSAERIQFKGQIVYQEEKGNGEKRRINKYKSEKKKKKGEKQQRKKYNMKRNKNKNV